MNSKLLKIILLAVVVIFLTAGYLYLTGKIKFNNEPAKVEEITETAQETEMAETSDWKTYRNEEYGFEIKYPIFWGDVVVEDNSVVYGPNDDFFGADIDYKKLLTEEYSLSFSKNNDFKVDVIVFSKDKPLQLDCYEGVCNAKNLFDDKSYIENHFNKDISGGLRWFCKENYFAPAASLLKTCRTYIGTTLIKLETGHKLVNRLWLDNYAGDRGKISFQDAYIQLHGDEKKNFDLLTINFNNLLDNIVPLENKTITNWKTYKNEGYGFEFKYPDDYETIDQLNDGGQLSIKPIGESEIPTLSIEFIHNQDKNLLENDSLRRLSDINKYRKVIDEQVKVGGFYGRKIGNSGDLDTEDQDYREIIIDVKGKILFITSGGVKDSLLNQILSTFKFTK